MFKTLEEALEAYKKLQTENGELKASVAALAAKRDELVSEKKAEKAKRESAESKVATLESELDETRDKLAKGAGDVDGVKKSLEAKHARDLADRDAKIADRDSRIQTLVVRNGLKAALTEAGVAAHFMEAAEAMLSAGAKVEADGDSYRAVIGDKPLAEAVKAWAASDKGKHFVANRNTGGGANGGGGVSGYEGPNPYAAGSINRTEQGRLERTDPDLAKALRAEAGKKAA